MRLKDTLYAELLAMTGGLFAGYWLSIITNQSYLIPGVLTLIPGFLDLGGNLGGMLSAKFGSAFNTGKLKPTYKFNKKVRKSIFQFIMLFLVVSLFLGFVACFISYFLYFSVEIRLIFVALLAGLFTSLAISFLTFYTSTYLFKHNHDPDDVMGPYITTISDVVGIICILLSIMVVGLA